MSDSAARGLATGAAMALIAAGLGSALSYAVHTPHVWPGALVAAGVSGLAGFRLGYGSGRGSS